MDNTLILSCSLLTGSVDPGACFDALERMLPIVTVNFVFGMINRIWEIVTMNFLGFTLLIVCYSITRWMYAMLSYSSSFSPQKQKQGQNKMDAPPSSTGFFSRETISDINGVVARSFTSVRTVVEDNVGWKTKTMIAFWITCSAASFVAAVYADGRNALMVHRSSGGGLDAEREIVATACKANTHMHFWDSAFLPYTVVSNVVPFVVLQLNPPPPPPVIKID